MAANPQPSALPEPMIIYGPNNHIVTIHSPKTDGEELVLRARNMMLHLHVDTVVFEHKQTGQFLIAAHFDAPTDSNLWQKLARVYFDPSIFSQSTVVGDTASGGDDYNPESNPSRAPNRWILYRREKGRELREKHQGITAGQISMMVAQMWDNEHPLVKDYYDELAKAEADRHRKM